MLPLTFVTAAHRCHRSPPQLAAALLLRLCPDSLHPLAGKSPAAPGGPASLIALADYIYFLPAAVPSFMVKLIIICHQGCKDPPSSCRRCAAPQSPQAHQHPSPPPPPPIPPLSESAAPAGALPRPLLSPSPPRPPGPSISPHVKPVIKSFCSKSSLTSATRPLSALSLRQAPPLLLSLLSLLSLLPFPPPPPPPSPSRQSAFSTLCQSACGVHAAFGGEEAGQGI
jgi:hypothetical protein